MNGYHGCHYTGNGFGAIDLIEYSVYCMGAADRVGFSSYGCIT